MDKIKRFLNSKEAKKRNISIDNIQSVNLKKLEDVFLKISISDIRNKTEMIFKLIQYNVSGNWANRINESKKFGRDSSSLNSHIVRYGKDVGHILFNEKVKKSTVNKENYLKKHSVEEWYKLCKSKANYGLSPCIDRYGKIYGPIKWQEILQKKLATQKENFKDKKWHNGSTLEEYQERHGIEDGYNRWKKRYDKHSYDVSKQRYIDQYGKKLGTKICHDLKDNTSKSAFIKRYGEKDGILKYKENCKKCAITEAKMICLYGEKQGKIKYKEWILKVTASNKNRKFNGYSKISQVLFWLLYDELNINDKNNCYFGELNNEYQFYVNHENNYPKKIIRVDFKCKNVIIEYDCDYYHDEDLDRQRDALLITKGYKILRINHNEFIKYKNRDGIINKCKQFINENA